MTKQDIEKIHWYQKEIEILDKDILVLREQSLGGLGDGMPHVHNGTSKTEQTALKIYELTKRMAEHKQKLIELVTECLGFIYSIDDPLARMVFKFRVLDNMSWERISEILERDRKTVTRKYADILKGLDDFEKK